MNQTNHFFNLGYGWLCKHCSAEQAELHQSKPGTREGEGDQKTRLAASLALAGWTGASRQSLKCPHCGIEEQIAGRAI